MKIFEYSAVSKPVLSTNLEELKRLKFPNVFLANPSASDFSEKIVKAINYQGKFPRLTEFDWSFLSKKLEKILRNI